MYASSKKCHNLNTIIRRVVRKPATIITNNLKQRCRLCTTRKTKKKKKEVGQRDTKNQNVPADLLSTAGNHKLTAQFKPRFYFKPSNHL